ncbi:polysaccharide lyase family 8 super-sandwich domain-containing protein [Vibrio nomapromontoriensis]|uniref:polysaccharide lyase family 8 super-sandwich domain-containing protein n=1 Tax=Vibrio nomapromontoriensis TaxID=2910246 RepID=UPI003D0DC78B
MKSKVISAIALLLITTGHCRAWEGNPFLIDIDNGVSSQENENTLAPMGALTSNYFDINQDASPGSRVVGRINFEGNRRPNNVSSDLHYRIAESSGEGASLFTIENVRDSKGRLFGQLVYQSATPLEVGAYPLQVVLMQANQAKRRYDITVNVGAQTQWQGFYQRAFEFMQSSKRLQEVFYFEDSEVADYIDELNDNNGAFTGFEFYHANSEGERLDIGARQLAKELTLAAHQIRALAAALGDSDTYGPNGIPEERANLQHALYLAVIRYVDHFPVRDFANTLTLMHNMVTHQWRFTDPMSSTGLMMVVDMEKDIASGDSLAIRAKERFHELLQIAFDLPYKQRRPKFNRYYLPNDLAHSPGAWADANRHHRMRTWVMMAALWHDYNRPLTYQRWWYRDYAPFAKQNTTLLPGWEPKGSLSDLNTWLETNARYAYKYGQAGMLPDGTISHHTGSRQDMAFFAYGFEWMTDTPFSAMKTLADTPWKVSSQPYNDSSYFLTDVYPALIYKGGLDFQVSGRSHASPLTEVFGSTKMQKGIASILEAKSHDTEIKNETDLVTLGDQLLNQVHEKSASVAFWNSDFLVHRSGEQGSPAYYMSFKMNSSRTLGAESFDPDTGYHNGSGILQIKVNGQEYSNVMDSWDWHALPGLTEELRIDELPMKSDLKLFNPNHYSGVASDGDIGVAGFKYASESPYNSASANKSVFFIGDAAYATGSQVSRVKNQESDEPIITTIDQVEWKSDVTYQIEGEELETIEMGSYVDQVLPVRGTVWFHQGDVGYVVMASLAEQTNVMLRGGDAVNSTLRGDVPVIHLAINHGVEPQANEERSHYRYVAVPNITADQMPSIVTRLTRSSTLIADESIHGMYQHDGANESIAMSFFTAGEKTISIPQGNPLTVSVDKPALVIMNRAQSTWKVTVQDPLHHVDKDAMEERGKRFKFCVRKGKNEIVVSVNRALQSGQYDYPRQGRVNTNTPSQIATVSSDDANSTIVFELPDTTDSKDYAGKEELYVGMPATITVRER